MVSSGLIENNDVSHFRLSIHLSLALFILCLIFWYILDIYKTKKFQNKIPNLLLLFILKLDSFTNSIWCFFIRFRWRSYL